jgi:acetyl-CoA synthetase
MFVMSTRDRERSGSFQVRGPSGTRLQPLGGRIYRSGDVARRDADGYFTYVGRADDLFKASDYRISPFELESAMIEHPAVAEAAIVPSPYPLRLAVPKAFVALAEDRLPDRATALSIFRHVRAQPAPCERIRRLEFAELPKTISGKIRRLELRRSRPPRPPLRRAHPGSFGKRISPSLAERTLRRG